VVASEEAQRRRRLNRDRLRIFGRDSERVIAFICECDDADCTKTVTLTAPEFRGLGDATLVHQAHPPAA
jgi:hypothetical protein